MKLYHKNILTNTKGLILHGVNCQKVMGSGIAKQIRERYPQVYKQYCVTHPKLGNFDAVEVSPDFFIGNCYTQEYYGRDGRRYAVYEAIEKSIDAGIQFAIVNKLDIHMPFIGCGLGGADKGVVTDILYKLENKWNKELHLYEL